MSATSDPDNQAPHVYATHLADLLQREYDRMGTLIARGEVIVRTVLSILTVFVAITALAVGASVGVRPSGITWVILGVSAVLGLASMYLGSLAQAAPSDLMTTDEQTIAQMVGRRWNPSAGDDPLRIVARRTAEAIESLRAANEKRARRARRALFFQFSFITVVLFAVATEVFIQMQ